MNWDFSYFVETSIITLCTIISIPAFIGANKAVPRNIRRYFYYLILILFLESGASYLDYVFDSVPDNRYQLLRILISVIGYVVRPAMMFVVLLIMTRDSQNKKMKYAMSLPLVISVIVAFMSFFTDQVFYYDENNQFVGGPLRCVFFIALVIYFLTVIVVNIINRRTDINESRIIFGIIVLLSVDMIFILVGNNNSLHEQIQPLAVILYFIHFVSVYHQEKMEEITCELNETEDRLTKRMLDQAIETLAHTIDAKDRYTRGHSLRVAKYARLIAKLDDRDEETCRKIYLAGLLHDIGKISIRDEIINKPGKLTNDEYTIIKSHPTNGMKILEKMKDYPYLQDGATYHHERYDGKGYPNGLKGKDIPEIARIISVADAYDAMTSHRSYRDTMNQADAKQEIWKGIGTQFDPYFAKLMISLIDSDLEYDMREKEDYIDEILFEDEEREIVWETKVPTEIKADNQVMMETKVTTLGSFAFLVNNWEDPSDAVAVSENESTVNFKSKTEADANYLWYAPTAILFSSVDGKVDGEDYDELGVFISAGYSWRAGSSIRANAELIKTSLFENWDQWINHNKQGMLYAVTAYRDENMVYLTIENELINVKAYVELPKDFDKPIYMTFTGERCGLSDLKNIQ